MNNLKCSSRRPQILSQWRKKRELGNHLISHSERIFSNLCFHLNISFFFYLRNNPLEWFNCRCHKRHILLKFYYLGWDYHGFTVQEDNTNTIEHHLFTALIKSCCVESRESANYHRCGRTDKGVSSFSQVISLDIRSRLEPEKQDNLTDELPYCKILNRLLPANIRCIAWCPVSPNFSARFDCKYRRYKYLFPKGNLNIDAMDRAVKYVIGNHDFRNICKMDVANGVTNFTRTVIDAKVSLSDQNTEKLTGVFL